jgi:hypothetical protein
VKEQCLIKSTKDKKKSSTWEDVQLTDGKVWDSDRFPHQTPVPRTVQMWETLQTLALPKTVDLQSNVFFPLRMAHVEALVIWLQNIIPYIIHLYEYNL